MKTAPCPLVFLAFIFTKIASAQTADPFLENCRSLALATATTAIPGEPGMTSNPASLAFFVKKNAISATAATPYLLAKWKKLNLAAAIPLGQNGHLSASISRSGIPDFFTTNFRVAYGRELTPRLGVGTTADFSGIRAGEYGRTSAVSAGIGLLWRPKDPYCFGFSIQNPTATGWKTGEDRSPIFRWGAMIVANPFVNTVFEIEKKLASPVNFKGGLEYSILKKITLRSGIRSGPFRWAFG